MIQVLLDFSQFLGYRKAGAKCDTTSLAMFPAALSSIHPTVSK